ncbi:MAG TPA: AAA family ATPase [Blastococcus sp.]|nr:AAA family ATPase [Blastococcus sp.]
MAVPAGTDPSPFVGRGRALADLRARLADARAGTGGLVLVGGPPGIGKTRTVEELLLSSEDVVWGRAVDDPGAPPLWPWRRVLRARPEVAAAVSEALADVDLVRERSADPAAARFRFVAAATEALLRSADPDGLVVVLEDLHWADDTSLRLLRHLAGELHRSRLLVVGTYRDPSGVADGRLERTLPDLLRWPGTHVIPLAPLAEDDVRAYLAAVGGAPVHADDVRTALRRSGGNPLYLRAVARSAGAVEPAAEPAGSELRHVVRATLAGLEPAVVELLATAAVLGEEVDADLLAAVADRPVEDVRTGLDAAVRAGVLGAVPDVPGRRRFVHAVVRDGIYADLSPSEREALHRRAAEAWEESVGVDDATAGVVAAHWLRAAADPAALRRAASWARRASVAATRSLAFDEAARFLGMALDAADRAGSTDEERAVLLVDLATAEFRQGRFAESLRHASAASEAAAACGRPDLLADAALVVHDVGAPGSSGTLTALCERALARPEVARLPALRSRLLSQMASALADAGRLVRAGELSAESLRLAEEDGDPETVLDAVRARMKTTPTALTLEERMRLGRLAVEHAAGTGRPLTALWGHKWRIDAALAAGDMATVHDELTRITALAQSTRLPLIRWHDVRLRASVEALYGRFEQAIALNDEARVIGRTQLAEDLSAAGMSAAFAMQHALVLGRPGMDDEGLESLDRADDVPIVLVTRALVALIQGRTDAATAQYEVLRRLVADVDFATSAGVATNMVPLVERFRDAETAGILADVLVRTPIAAGGAGVYCSGSLSVLLGRLAIVRGRVDDAIDRFAESLASDTGIGARPAVVHDRIGLAGALLERGRAEDVPRAGQLAREALEEARRLGMPGPLRNAAALADRARAAARAVDPLTEREREITALVAQALTNRQIAERLVLSERTVESHVRNILAKLGLANRTQIATATLAPGSG